MRSVCFLCLLVATFSPVALGQDGYESFPSVPGARYKLYDIRITWPDALTLCQGDGGGSHLVIINSEAEAAVVRELAARIADTAIWGVAVGMSDLAQEGTWVTLDGGLVSLSGYNIWQTTEPDGGTGQNCGYADRQAGLVDYQCSSSSPFICEKQFV